MAAASVRSAGVCAALAACLVAQPMLRSSTATTSQSPTSQKPQATFRAGVDVVEMDVSVLDKNHKPVRGLTANDFTILEDSKPQHIVAFSEEYAAAPVPPSAPWMRAVPLDVESNDVADKQLFVIVLDDATLSPAIPPPFDKPSGLRMGMVSRGGGGARGGGGGDPNIDVYRIDTLRKVALRAIDLLGDGDIAAVVFANDGFKGQTFTADRSKLIEAVNSVTFGPPYYASDADPSRTDCQPLWYTTGALRSAVEALSSVPHRRKTVLYVSVGLEIPILGQGPPAYQLCASRSQNDVLEIFRMAQLANVNIYSIDPSGLRVRADNERHDFLRAIAENTGGRAVIDTNDDVGRVEHILEEVRSYYLIGYERPGGTGDGRFHRVEVKVGRPAGAEVQSRHTRYDPAPPSVASASAAAAAASAASAEGSLGEFLPKTDIFAEATVAPFRSDKGSPTVLITLAGRLPLMSAPLSRDRLNVVIRAFTPDGRDVAAHQENVPVTLEPPAPAAATGGPTTGPRFELVTRMNLAPGRYSLRIGVQSAALDKAGSVYLDVTVPDFSSETLSLSGVAFTPSASSVRGDALSSLTPTTVRTFDSTDRMQAFLRVYQSGGTLSPVTLRVRLVDSHNADADTRSQTLPPAAFASGRQADFDYRLPLSSLKPGEYWLSFEASIGRLIVKRDVRFSVR